ncbi:MAG: formylglycine-generating enzyme family protein [Hyphomicrobiales bacterium]|nr:MAG: formylglycine-generating enzyme family protein [Hyphomicrobiales bacterium]
MDRIVGRCFSPLLSVLVLLGMTSLTASAASDNTQRAGTVFKDCANCPEMVVVPAGEFMMGSPETERGRSKNEGPQHKVTIAQPFAVGKVEVTFAQWDECVKEGGCATKPDDSGWGRGRRPVINVSYDDAKEFVAWLAKKTGKPYRLLTEAEWEYAARAQTKWNPSPPPFSTGATIHYQQANYDANFSYGKPNGGLYRQKTVDTGTLPKNAFGLHEMHGNVWEWVEDCYKDSYAGAPTDGSAVQSANCELRILRGGSWNYHPNALRAAYRYATFGGLRVNQAGFRVARSL